MGEGYPVKMFTLQLNVIFSSLSRLIWTFKKVLQSNNFLTVLTQWQASREPFGFLAQFIQHKYLCTVFTWSWSSSETSQQLSGQRATTNQTRRKKHHEKKKKSTALKKREEGVDDGMEGWGGGEEDQTAATPRRSSRLRQVSFSDLRCKTLRFPEEERETSVSR